MTCATHSEAQTSLRCSKCGILICPKCMVQTPVGARCRNCARVRRIPTYNVPLLFYFRGLGAGLGAGALISFLWFVIDRFIPFFYLDLILAGAFGYAIGELISLAANRKRGRGLMIIGGACFALAYGIKVLFFEGLHPGAVSILFSLIALAIGVVFTVSRLR